MPCARARGGGGEREREMRIVWTRGSGGGTEEVTDGELKGKEQPMVASWPCIAGGVREEGRQKGKKKERKKKVQLKQQRGRPKVDFKPAQINPRIGLVARSGWVVPIAQLIS